MMRRTSRYWGFEWRRAWVRGCEGKRREDQNNGVIEIHSWMMEIERIVMRRVWNAASLTLCSFWHSLKDSATVSFDVCELWYYCTAVWHASHLVYENYAP
jgi:hypothetical protein